MKRKSLTFKFVLFNLGVLLAFSSLFLFSSNSYALSLTNEVRLISVYSTGLTVIGPNISYTNVTSASGGTTGAGVETFRIHFNNASCVPGDIYQVNINFFNTNQNDSLDAWISSVYGGDNDFSFIETQYQQLDGSTGQVSFTLACTSTFTNANRYLTLVSATGSTLWLYPQEWISTFYVARYTPVNTATDTHEIAENAYEINQKIDDIVSALGTNQDSLDTINDNIESVNENLSQANDDANDRYQDEKDTINDNASDAQDSADSISPSFSITNPLTDFFNSFKDDRCVDIPNLAAWVHWDGDAKLGGAKRICSPWPTNVRDVVTPVVTGLFGLVLTGFVIRWFKGSFTTETN